MGTRYRETVGSVITFQKVAIRNFAERANNFKVFTIRLPLFLTLFKDI